MFREKTSIPEYTGFEIGKTGFISVSVLTIQYRIGNTTPDTNLEFISEELKNINL
jgi:hypothetical protein